MKKEKYDAVIIGAGIGGLVCGCYLAKYGMKVLLVEAQKKPGGYCVSFERDGFIFDAGAHSVGTMKEDGIMSKILNDLEIRDRIRFTRSEIIDKIIFPDKETLVYSDPQKFIDELSSKFYNQKEQISKFFNFILESNYLSIIAQTEKSTFSDVLNTYFQDDKLKAVLSVLLANIGLSSGRASALVSIILYKEFILDGGYYPKNGMQAIPDILARRMVEYGADIVYSSKAKKILLRGNKAIGIELDDGEKHYAEYIVSNADAVQTFTRLIGSDTEEFKKLPHLTKSTSAFVVYLGLKNKTNHAPECLNSWKLDSYDAGNCRDFSHELVNEKFFLCSFPTLVEPALAPPGKSILRLLVMAKYMNKQIWDDKKDQIAERLIAKGEEIIPGLRSSIEVEEIATPYTFYEYTSNAEGALFGWAAIPGQVEKNTFPAKTSIENLYLTGHWVTNGIGQSGIPVVALCGKNTAGLIKRASKR